MNSVKTYGKGVVQRTFCIGGTRQADGSCSNEMLKVTVASWYTPSGKSINHEGIKPDQEVKPGKDDTRGGPDAQKERRHGCPCNPKAMTYRPPLTILSRYTIIFSMNFLFSEKYSELRDFAVRLAGYSFYSLPEC